MVAVPATMPLEVPLPKLVVEDSDRTWLVDLQTDEGVVVGRSPDCDVRIQAARASRRHAEFVVQGGGHVVRDLDSTNGTVVNGMPIAADVQLGDGDKIEVGGCRIVYRSRP